MLLVETDPVSLAAAAMLQEEVVRFSLETDDLMGLLFVFDRELVDDESGSKEVVESLTPVRRNLLCF